jgi:hypothetical protein
MEKMRIIIEVVLNTIFHCHLLKVKIVLGFFFPAARAAFWEVIIGVPVALLELDPWFG